MVDISSLFSAPQCRCFIDHLGRGPQDAKLWLPELGLPLETLAEALQVKNV